MAFFQTQKALTIKETDKSDFIKIKNFFYLKMPDTKRLTILEDSICKIYF